MIETGDSAHWRGDSLFAIVPGVCLDAIRPTVKRLNSQNVKANCSTATAEAVFTRLALFAGRDGSCHPYLATIAECLDIQEAAVRRATRVLEEAGILTKTPRLVHGRKVGNQYELHLPRALTRGGLLDGTRVDGGSADRALVDVPYKENKTSSEQDHLYEEESPKTTARVATTAKRARPRNLAFDALVTVCDGDERKTGVEAGKTAAALKQIREAVGPEIPVEDLVKHIEARARRYRVIFSNAPLTPNALAANWSLLGPKSASQQRPEMTPEKRLLAAAYAAQGQGFSDLS